MAKRMTNQQRAVAKVMGEMRYEEFRNICKNTTPALYAAIAMALYEKGWRYERINNLFARSQEIWEDKCWSGNNMMEECYEMTGIDLRSSEIQ